MTLDKYAPEPRLVEAIEHRDQKRYEDEQIRHLHEKGWGLHDIARFLSCSEAKVISVVRSLKSHN